MTEHIVQLASHGTTVLWENINVRNIDGNRNKIYLHLDSDWA